MVKVYCLGGGHEVGGNAFLVDAKKKIMFDYGLHVGSGTTPYPPKGNVDAAFLSHGHLDHVGAIPLLQRTSKCPIYWTKPTERYTELLLKDAIKIASIKKKLALYSTRDIANLSKHSNSINYADEINFGQGVKVSVWDAGHMPGSCMFTINAAGKKILYTGDMCINKTRLLSGARFDDVADAIILDTTYSSREHPSREEEEKKFYKTTKDTIDNGGIALLPSFATRAPELLLILHKLGADFPIYLDGMARSSTEIALKYPEFVKNHDELKAAVTNVTTLHSYDERIDAVKKPCAIITTSGGMEGGPITHFMKYLYTRTDSAILFTGYQMPGTAARYLADTGRFIASGMDLSVKLALHNFDFSGHTGRTDLIKFVKKVKPNTVVCVHGDFCEKFAIELKGRFGMNTIAPKNGDMFEV